MTCGKEKRNRGHAACGRELTATKTRPADTPDARQVVDDLGQLAIKAGVVFDDVFGFDATGEARNIGWVLDFVD